MSDTLTVRIPIEIRKELEKICRHDSLSMSDIIRDSLRKFIAIRQFRKMRNKVLPFAEAQGLLTDEDVFEALS